MSEIKFLKLSFKIPVPHIGMRMIKSAIAVFCSFIIWQLFRLAIPSLNLHPLMAYISAVLTMRDTKSNSLSYGLLRVKGTVIGLIVALIAIWICLYFQSHFYSDFVNAFIEILLILAGVVISLYVARILNCKNLCGIASAVFLVCMVSYNSDARYLYALRRTAETMLGVVVSVLINKYIFPYYEKKGMESNECDDIEEEIYLLKVDIGTTSFKATVFNGEGKLISSKNVDYNLITKGKFSEIEAERHWELLQETVRDAVGDLKISAFSINTQGETIDLKNNHEELIKNDLVWINEKLQKTLNE